MKIKEILTDEELKRCTHWGNLVCIEDIECELSRHYPEMELKEYFLFRILMELEDIKRQGEQE